MRSLYASPVKDIISATVKKCLSNLISVFRMLSYVYSDRGTSFISREMKKCIGTSKTTSYNPTDNGQVKRYNCIIWKSLMLAFKSWYLPIESWESVLPDVLHSIQSLLCTSTNCTLHEKLFNFQQKSTSRHFGSISKHPVTPPTVEKNPLHRSEWVYKVPMWLDLQLTIKPKNLFILYQLKEG